MENSSSAIVVSNPETKISKKEMYRPWSELTDPIIEVIYSDLDFIDKFRMASVCISWRNVAPWFARRRPQQLIPWLLFFHDAPTEALVLLNLPENMVHQIRIPRINMKLCCGSSEGWLFMLDDARENHCFLLNPFTKARIQLPPLSIDPPNAIRKVILSSDPRINEDWMVVVHLTIHGLVFCKSGYSSWSTGPPRNRFWYPYDDRDIIFFEGKVYALGMLHSLWIFDMEPQKYILKGSAVAPSYDLYRNTDPVDDGYISYLVASDGDVFLISRFLKNIRKPCTACESLSTECIECQAAINHYVTLNFLVYKLKENNDRRRRTEYVWARQSSLGVNRALFLSKRGSTSVSTIETPGLHGNCIYFTNDLHPETTKSCDIGIYNLEDDQIERLIQLDSYPLEFPLIWITPSI
ncbi:F-box protein At2g05970-like [Macadamia integrifolia]|uniref:F-box protein At2g05970-like n=1 Tax=Macadamia integrifolia TaxID=60698 RepID=UPI001C52748D|nr:F-box protein At2g05970-like [Macadamia integrifolia]